MSLLAYGFRHTVHLYALTLIFIHYARPFRRFEGRGGTWCWWTAAECYHTTSGEWNKKVHVMMWFQPASLMKGRCEGAGREVFEQNIRKKCCCSPKKVLLRLSAQEHANDALGGRAAGKCRGWVLEPSP